jgi:hypothetical protein
MPTRLVELGFADEILDRRKETKFLLEAYACLDAREFDDVSLVNKISPIRMFLHLKKGR